MGDISVDVFLNTLNNLVMSSNIDYIKDEEHQLQSLVNEIDYLRGFLKLTEKKRDEHPEVMKLVMRIREVVSEIENMVELFVVRVYKANHSHPEDRLSLDLESIMMEIKTLRAEVEHIRNKNLYDINGVAVPKLKHSSSGSGGGSSLSQGRNTYKVGDEKVVVGFEDEIKTLMGKLHDSGDNGLLEIISIISIGGCGKTTLAREVYDCPLTLQKFYIRAWVNVSHDYDQTRKKDLLISILESASPESNEDYKKYSEDVLGEMVYKRLQGRKYLIVMDDIWDIEAWNGIQRSYPKECKGSKVLFTSRQLVQPDSVRCIRHDLNLLSESYSWELLRMKVFKKEQCPSELVDIGNQIARKCKGLPLAVVAIAGVLATKDKTLNMWEEVAKHLNSIIAENQDGTMEILELSYNHLPLHLKACFLYIGAQPEDEEIYVRKLAWLWITEGFIQKTEGGKSLEAVAEDYLTDLIDRNLVMVARKRSIGTIKACHIHDLLREFCLKKGKEDNFFAQYGGEDSFSPSETNRHRRLFFSTELVHQFHSRPCAQNVRSYVCLKERRYLEKSPRENLSLFVETFPLLKVLYHHGCKTIGQIQKGDLLGLRYLALTLASPREAPFPRFYYLPDLEVLAIEFGRVPFSLPWYIFKMVKLRHIYSRMGRYKYHDDSHDEDKGNTLDSLQTLSSMGSCKRCLRFLKRTPNLRKVKVDVFLCDKEDGCFILPNLEFLNCLEILHIRGHGERETMISTGLKLPSTLTQLTLSGTHLEWEKLSTILQTLSSLEVLKLLGGSCIGPVWDTSALEEGFSQLKYLRLSGLEIEEWIASEDLLPRLEVLDIRNCSHLKSIPIDFANLYELREIRIESSTLDAEESAKKILEEQRDTKGDDACLNLLARDNYNRAADDSSN